LAENILHTVLRGFRTDVDHKGEFIVIGLGRFGSSLGTTLVDMGHEVLGIDADATRVQDHSGLLTHVAEADTTSVKALRQLGVADAITVAVCIGADVEASVLTTAALADLGVPNIWAKAFTEPHGRILSRVGAHNVVFPEAEMGSRVAHLLTGEVIEYLALDEDFVLIETVTPSWLVNRALGETNLRRDYKVTIVCIKPDNGVFTYAESATVLQPNDLIVIAGHRADIDRFANADH
jgi:trk system potassium uptake protein TrkA